MFTNKLLSKKFDCGHITTRNSRRKKIKKTPFEEAAEINNIQKVDNKHVDTSQNNTLKSSANQDGTENEDKLTDLAGILPNLIIDNIPSALNVTEQDLLLTW